MTQEELIISTLHDITIGHLDGLGQEISAIEELLTERRLYRKWVQDPEGADLFSGDLARVEAQLAEKEGQREAFLESLVRLDIEVYPLTAGHIFYQGIGLATTHRLSVYDATYLGIAIREQVPLATQDGELIRAAKEIGVPIFQP